MGNSITLHGPSKAIDPTGSTGKLNVAYEPLTPHVIPNHESGPGEAAPTARPQAIQFVRKSLVGSPKASAFADDVEEALNDPRPRVRWAAFSTLAQIAPEKAVTIQEKWLEQ